MLSRILVVDPSKRATLAELGQHPWISKGGEGPIENYFPTRLPLTLPLDDQVIRGMRGFEFGTEDEIREHLTSIILSAPYLKACDQYTRLLEAATSSAIAEKSEKRKPFSLEFYKRKSVSAPGSWPENGITSSSSLQFDDPTNAFDPLLSIYYLVREKQERDRQSTEPPARSSGGLSSPKTERALRLPTIPIPKPPIPAMRATRSRLRLAKALIRRDQELNREATKTSLAALAKLAPDHHDYDYLMSFPESKLLAFFGG